MYRGSSHEPKLRVCSARVRGSGAFREAALYLLAADRPREALRERYEWCSTVKPACEGSGGVIGSENVDMSSDKAGERPARRKSKGSCLKLI